MRINSIEDRCMKKGIQCWEDVKSTLSQTLHFRFKITSYFYNLFSIFSSGIIIYYCVDTCKDITVDNFYIDKGPRNLRGPLSLRRLTLLLLEIEEWVGCEVIFYNPEQSHYLVSVYELLSILYQ